MRSLALVFLAVACGNVPNASKRSQTEDDASTPAFGLTKTPAFGCPMFHCDDEAASTLYGELSDAPHARTWQSKDAGALVAQGCSGDAKSLACLYLSDKSGSGTFKVFDVATKTERFGSKKPGSYNPSAFSSIGQVPFITATGDFVLADDKNLVRYDRTGRVTRKQALSGLAGINFGVGDLDGTRGFFSMMNGTVAVFDWDTLAIKSTLKINGTNNAPATIASPATSHRGRIYAPIVDTAKGDLKPATLSMLAFDGKALRKRWSLPFKGVSGASAVILPAAPPSRPYPRILLHIPASASDTRINNQLIAVDDLGTGYRLAWSFPLAASLQVSPVADLKEGRIYFHEDGAPILTTLDLDGKLVGTFDVRTLVVGPVDWSTAIVNGHMAAARHAGAYRLLLSVGSTSGEYVLAFDPRTKTAPWTVKIHATAEDYTAAWSLSERAGGNCPVVIGPASGINVLCPSRAN